MKDYQRILVGTDFSDPSISAARRGAELARHYGATLILLHVVEHFIVTVLAKTWRSLLKSSPTRL